jgi:aspartokinase
LSQVSNGLIECGGLLERGNLCLIEFLGLDGTPGVACGILARFGDAGIPLAYVSIGNGPRKQRNMSFCVDRMDLPACHPLVETVRSDHAPELVVMHEPATKLTLYGPHFQEKHALVAGVFAALCERGIKAHGIAMSVNSISFVVNSGDRDLAIECLRQRFAWPE